MFFENKQKQVEKLLDEYYQEVSDCLAIFERSFKEHLEHSERGQLIKNFSAVHEAESRADDLRREVEVMMYAKALFPESRGDILGLLETMDRVPNQAEAAVQMLLSQHVSVPQYYHENLMNLVVVCHRCVDAMLEGAQKLFSDFTGATVTLGRVDELESQADHIEETIIEQVFASDIDGFDKILIRDLTKQVAAVSDRAENVGDRIRIIVAKRRT